MILEVIYHIGGASHLTPIPKWRNARSCIPCQHSKGQMSYIPPTRDEPTTPVMASSPRASCHGTSAAKSVCWVWCRALSAYGPLVAFGWYPLVAGLCFLMLLFCTDLIFAFRCSWNESVCWVCKDEPKINSAGWIVVTKDISAYFLMQTFVSLWSIGSFWLVPSCCWSVFFDAFVLHWSDLCIPESVCWVCKDEPKINSAGWIVVTKDISAYFLMQTFVSLWSIGSFWLVPSCCWSVFFDAFVLHWSDLCIPESVCWVCKDEPKINSAGWIVVTKDISAYFLMQSFVSLWSIGSFWLVPSCCWSVFFDAFVLHWSDFCIQMQLKRICLLGLQGWTQDKFSGLNCSDERHLRLLSDADLCQLMVHW